MSHHVWLMGGRGLVGQAVHRALRNAGHRVTATGSEVDITKPTQLFAFAETLAPTHIINCAAMTRVDLCESEQAPAMAINGDGAHHVALAAKQHHATVLHVSSDYVFDGRHKEPRREHDPTSPQSIYGRSKLVGEQRFLKVLQASGVPHYVLRTSWVFGPGGNNFVSTMLRLMRDCEVVQVVDDQHGRPTYSLHLAQAMLELLGMHSASRGQCPSGIYHFANAGATTWHGLCEEVRRQGATFGHELRCRRVEPISTQAMPRPAPRPAYSVLSTDKFAQTTGFFPKTFQEAVADYLPRVSLA